MRAFLLHTDNGLWMAFGKDAVEAAKTLPTSVDQDRVGVGGTYSTDKPIDLYRFWPYFTATPSKTKSPE